MGVSLSQAKSKNGQNKLNQSALLSLNKTIYSQICLYLSII